KSSVWTGAPLARSSSIGSMKSGPTLNTRTRCPMRRKRRASAAVIVVLPWPDAIAATSTMRAPACVIVPSPLPFGSGLGADAGAECVLYHLHLGDGVGDLDQLGRRRASGDHDVLHRRAVEQVGDHGVHVEVAVLERDV